MLNIDFENLNKVRKDKYGRVSGVLALRKEKGITSHDVVDQVRKKLRTRKVGHVGALDPFATGLLLLLVGKDTRKTEMLLKEDKTYTCRVLLGIETDSHDIDGEILSSEETSFSEDKIKSVVEQFPKEYNQYVPIFSSVKVSGMKLRELARSSESYEITEENNIKYAKFILKPETKGKLRKKSRDGIVEIELPFREVVVDIKYLSSGNLSDSDLNNYGLSLKGKYQYVDLEVACSKGTYIRQLAYDIGEKLGTKGILIELERTQVGEVSLDQAVNPAELPDL